MRSIVLAAGSRFVLGLCLVTLAFPVEAQHSLSSAALESAVRAAFPSSWSVAERKDGQIPWGHHWCDEYKGVTGVLLVAVGPSPVPVKFLDASGTWTARPVARESLEIWIMPATYHDNATAALCFQRPVQPTAVVGTRDARVWARPAHRINSDAEFNAILSQYRAIAWPESPSNDATRLSWPSWQHDISSSVLSHR
jgi:hypothetical protein